MMWLFPSYNLEKITLYISFLSYNLEKQDYNDKGTNLWTQNPRLDAKLQNGKVLSNHSA